MPANTATKPKASTKPAKADPAAAPKKISTALAKPTTPSPALAAIVGSDPLPRTEVVSKVWDYIKTHDLQNPANKREIIADEKLKAVFGQDRATMFEMNKLLSAHLR